MSSFVLLAVLIQTLVTGLICGYMFGRRQAEKELSRTLK